jgi:hypothetical protein
MVMESPKSGLGQPLQVEKEKIFFSKVLSSDASHGGTIKSCTNNSRRHKNRIKIIRSFHRW